MFRQPDTTFERDSFSVGEVDEFGDGDSLYSLTSDIILPATRYIENRVNDVISTGNYDRSVSLPSAAREGITREIVPTPRYQASISRTIGDSVESIKGNIIPIANSAAANLLEGGTRSPTGTQYYKVKPQTISASRGISVQGTNWQLILGVIGLGVTIYYGYKQSKS
jgi:hypothetical protein